MSVKSKVLFMLEEEKGNYISGERVAELLQCSRAAVWKAVRALRLDGYQIEAVTNKGYRLKMENNILSEEAIRKNLMISELPIYVYAELNSTNELLKQKIINEPEQMKHGAAVIAGSQTHGRGRKGRGFASPKGGLYISVLLRPEGTMGESLSIRASAAVAVYEAILALTGKELAIHWINDLYYDGNKVCGMLTEAITDFETGDLEWAIVGIGILLDEFLEDETIDRSRLAAELINQVLIETAREEISKSYIEKNEVLGRYAEFTAGKRKERVFVQDILPDASLEVINQAGLKEKLVFGEIQLYDRKDDNVAKGFAARKVE